MSKIKEIQEVKISYQTTDGEIYDDKTDAESHQKYLDAPKVYIVFVIGSPIVFSEYEFAEKYANTYKPELSVREVAVDLRKNDSNL